MMHLLRLLAIALATTTLAADPPAPQLEVTWRTDLDAALQEAGRTDRPLFVTMRCLPCKQCLDFDTAVLEGGDLLDPLLKKFITVRITNADAIDFRIFPMAGFQDTDVSWWGYFLSPDAAIYGVFGGVDHTSDKSRISVKALATTMTRILDHHYASDTPKTATAPPDLSGSAKGPRDLPGWESWEAKSPGFAKQSCIHCHQVGDILHQPRIDAGTFKPKIDLAVWPLPENIGLTLDRDHGLKVTAVEAGSAADTTGLKVGDVLVAANDVPLFSQADFRGVLHRERADPARFRLTVQRGDRQARTTLTTQSGWRLAPLLWRKSVSDGKFGAGLAFGWPLKGPKSGRGSLSVKPWFGKAANKSPAYAAGLRPNMVITAINGESPDLIGRELVAWFRLKQHNSGQPMTLTVQAGGKEQTIRYKLP